MSYCTCKVPDIDGTQEDGYFCEVCGLDIEMPDYVPDPDLEYEAQWEQEHQEELNQL